MMRAIEHDDEQAKRLQGPQTARGRLYEWARVRHWEPVNVWPPESAMYAVLHNPGRATNTQSDGGMVNMCAALEEQPVSHAMRVRCRITQDAIDLMPKDYRLVVRSMYEVEKRERPRALKAAAEKAVMAEDTFRKTMDMALAWLQGKLDLAALRANGDMG